MLTHSHYEAAEPKIKSLLHIIDIVKQNEPKRGLMVAATMTFKMSDDRAD